MGRGNDWTKRDGDGSTMGRGQSWTGAQWDGDPM